MPALREDEIWAGQLIEASIGRPVVQHDDGSSPGMHDLWIVNKDADNEAVEITAAADPEAIPLWKLLNNSGERWIDERLKGGWRVKFTPTARARAIKKDLPGLLLDVESVDIGTFATTDLPKALQDQATALGIVTASHGPTDFPGSIYPLIDQDAINGLTNAEHSFTPLPAWIAEFLEGPERSDVLAKLARSGAPSRHVFIVVPALTTAPISVVSLLLHDDPPHGLLPDPELPVEVTDVWLASSWAVGSGLRWSPDFGWQRFRTDLGDLTDDGTRYT